MAPGSTGTTGAFAVNDVIQINANDSTGVYVITSVTSNVALTAQGGGGGSDFAYQNAYWVSQANGNDSSAGTSINTPLKTYAKALLLAGTTPTIIYGVDCYTSNAENLTTAGTGQNLFISAAGTVFTGAVTVTSDSLALNCSDCSNLILNGGYIDFTGNNLESLTQTAGVFIGNTGQISTAALSGGSTFINANLYNTVGGINLSNNHLLNIFCQTFTGTINNDGTAYVNGILNGNRPGINGDMAIHGQLILGTAISPGSYYALPVSDGAANSVLQTNGGGIVSWQSVGGISGGTSLGGTEPIYAGVSGSNLTFKGVTAGSNITLTPSGSDITISASGGTYTPFAYQNALWVSLANGNDSNLGTSIETPLLTISYALTIASTNPTMPYVIYVIDGDATGPTFNTPGTGQPIYIHAPGVDFTNGFSITFGDLVHIKCAGLSRVTVHSTAVAYIDVNTIHGFGLLNQGGTVYLNCDNANAQASNITLLGTMYANINNLTAPCGLGAGSSLYLSCKNITGSGRLNNDGTGYVNGILGAFSNDLTATVVNVNATFTSLAAAALVNVVTAPSTFAQYQVSNMYINFGGTNFSGGDRDLAITDGTTVYTVIPSASLLALPGNEIWGGIDIPFPSSAAISTSTLAGTNLYMQYSGGTTDYIAGSITLTVEYVRVA